MWSARPKAAPGKKVSALPKATLTRAVQQHLRLLGERASNRNTLLLPAAERVHRPQSEPLRATHASAVQVRGARAALLCARLQTHCCKRSFDARGHLARRQPEASQAESDVCPGRRHDHLVVRVLEDKRARRSNAKAAAIWAQQAAADAQQCRLPRSFRVSMKE